MKEQIEEMAKVIDEFTEPLSARDIHKAEFSEQFAEHLYNAGYRKQIEGEWIVDAWDSEKFKTIPYIKHEHTDPYCSLCKSHALLDGAEFGVASNFCPNCGAKMKGGAE